MINPPKEGEEYYKQYNIESNNILKSLKKRSQKLSIGLDQIDGIDCPFIQSALYAFPTINLPPKAIKKAENQNLSPDMFYCKKLLQNTGIMVVPGSGFGKCKDTFHFRYTILPPEEEIDEVSEKLKIFHKKFLEKYT